MIHLYPIQKKATIILAIGIFSSLLSLGQICGPIVENFDNTSGSMAGFTSVTQGSLSPGFVLGTTGQDGYLERCNTTANTTYQIVTPTYQTAATQTSLAFGFELSGHVEASYVYFFLDYYNTITGTFVSNYIAAVVPTYVANTATVCMDLPFTSIPGFVAGGAFRLNIFILSASSSNNNQCIVFDDFRSPASISPTILPVSFTGIFARKAGNNVEIIWNVAGEKEVSHYEVERSSDARNFTSIGEVTATGSSAYSFTDKNAGSGVVYYRVRNVDQDGQFSYSKVVRVNLSKSIRLNAYPQPVTSEINIEHSLSLNGKIVIASASGQVIKTVQVKTGDTQTTINVSALRPGMYIIRFDNGQGDVESIKMIKQ